MTLIMNSKLFGDEVRFSFEFLESIYSMKFVGVKEKIGDPRDTIISAHYQGDTCRLDVAWNEQELSLNILIYLNRDDLPNDFKYIYLDSYIEFISNGKEKNIIPQIFAHMKTRNILKVMKKREKIFKDEKFVNLLTMLALRLKKYFIEIMNAPKETIQSYQKWMQEER